MSDVGPAGTDRPRPPAPPRPAASRPAPARPAPARPAPARPAFAPGPTPFTVEPPPPRVLTASCLVWVAGILVSALAGAVLAANLAPVRGRLETGLAVDNPGRSAGAVADAVTYTLAGTGVAAVALAVVQLVGIVVVRRRVRAGRVLLLGAGALNLVSLLVSGALLADAQVGASSGQLRLVGLAPMLHAVLLVVAAVLLLLPEPRDWLARRPPRTPEAGPEPAQ